MRPYTLTAPQNRTVQIRLNHLRENGDDIDAKLLLRSTLAHGKQTSTPK